MKKYGIRIKFRLEVWGTSVLFQILDQKISSGALPFTASNGWMIQRMANPDINGNQIFLRGNTVSMDQRVCVKKFNTHDQALTFRNQVIETFKEFERWCRGEKPELEDTKDNIFLFEA